VNEPDPPPTQRRDRADPGTTLREAPAGDGTTLGRAPREPDDASGATLLRPTSERQAAPTAGIAAGSVVKQRFVLESVIGSGAMGQVWRAKDLIREQARNARPQVAIKLLNTDCAQQPDAFVGLEREASKAQDLAHPNVITVYDFDFDRDLQRAFISMELLEGDSLDTRIRAARRTGIARADALPIIEGVSDGLAYAHKKRVVHCDLKPGNIFVTVDGTPKILDFGIARAARTEADAGAVASDGFQGFTPAYASVEMIRDLDPLPVDDIYSLGVLLYELLTGRHPFNALPADQAQAKGLQPAPIRGLKAREWRAIERALAFERSARWSDAAAFRRAFRGTSAIPKVLAGAVVVLALAASVFWYQGWRAAQPDVPFEQLPVATQQAFLRHVSDGADAWQLVQSGQSFSINDVFDHYAAAYELHPRDARAVAGLEQAADFVIDKLRTPSDPAGAAQQLEALEQRSAYLAHYPPLTQAVDRLRSRR
jgi:serine/threonine protein kinase